MEIEFFVEGEPVSQGSKNGFIRGNRVVMVESGGAKLAKWRKQVATIASQEAADAKMELYDGACAVDLTFYMPKPKSKPKTQTLVSTKPDIDKLIRAVLDSLTGTIITNDSRVVDIVARKRYSIEAPGVSIKLTSASEPTKNTLFDD